jgi:hypothetical protein
VHPKVEKRFAKAVLSSGLVSEEDLERARGVQEYAAKKGRALPLDRVLLKLDLLSRDEILGLWRALRYYLWRKEDKFFVKLAIQSKLLTEKLARTCLKEQKRAYKGSDELIRVNEIARQRGYLTAAQDRAIVDAMKKVRPVSLAPADEAEGDGYEPRSAKAATESDGDAWKSEARSRDLQDLRGSLGSSAELAGVSDEDLDALWEEADLDDVELDSQAFEMAQGPLLDDDDDDDDLFDLL